MKRHVRVEYPSKYGTRFAPLCFQHGMKASRMRYATADLPVTCRRCQEKQDLQQVGPRNACPTKENTDGS